MARKEEHYKLYQAWADMKYRGTDYPTEWVDYNNFRKDMINSYLEALDKGRDSRNIILGRINPDLGYSVENCKWMTRSEHNSRMGNARSNFIVAEDYSGKRKVFASLTDMACFYGVSRNGANNALHRGTFFIKEIKFSKITREDYDKAIENPSYMNTLTISYNVDAYEKNLKKLCGVR